MARTENTAVIGTVYLRGPVLYGSCQSEITDELDANMGRGHSMGLVPHQDGKKTMGIAWNGTIHAYLELTETDVVTGARVVKGAYGGSGADAAALRVLMGYRGYQLRYAKEKTAGTRDKTDRGMERYACCC